MDSEEPSPGGFRPGDKVRVTSGTFVGMTGTVLPAKEAVDRSFPVCDWNVFVLLTIFGHEVPAHFEPRQLEPD
jgi:transcription antitermination factor NusG